MRIPREDRVQKMMRVCDCAGCGKDAAQSVYVETGWVMDGSQSSSMPVGRHVDLCPEHGAEMLSRAVKLLDRGRGKELCAALKIVGP